MKVLILLGAIIFSLSVEAAKIKVGVIAPEGTNWSKNLKKFAKEVKEKTNNEVNFKFYFGGSQGDEPDVLRKIRVGQLQGGIFTGKTLGDINGDVRVLEIPFNFYGDVAKANKAMRGMEGFFNHGFSKNEFVNLGFTEIGLVYFVSQKKVASIEEMKGIKVWTWEGDKVVETVIKNMNLVSVPLALPDVLSSLTTGIIDSAYAPPLGIVAFQWNSKVKYLLDFPLAYSVGAFLISEKGFNEIPAKYRDVVKQISNKYLTQVEEGNRQDNSDALASLKTGGVEYLQFADSDKQKAETIRAGVIKSLEGNLFSKEALERLEKFR